MILHLKCSTEILRLRVQLVSGVLLLFVELLLDNAIIIVDEFQNLNFHELDSIITRVGENSKIMFCGDATQSDLVKTNERNGIVDFMRILRVMPSMSMVEFGVEDIVRSGLCKEYLVAKMELNL
jgi:phosphate starvation-inducible protein PhoH